MRGLGGEIFREAFGRNEEVVGDFCYGVVSLNDTIYVS